MPRKKKLAIPEPAKVQEFSVPAHVASARVMRRKRIGKKGLPKLTLDMMVAWGPEMVSMWFTEKYKAAKAGDKEALDDIAEVYGLISRHGSSGSMVNVNVGGQMAVAGGNGVGYDAFVRKWNDARRQGQLPSGLSSVAALDFRRAETKGSA